jgi:uncharacterized protein
MTRLITRRRVLQGLALTSSAAVATSGYAIGYAPIHHRITSYALTPPGWTPSLALRIVLLADPHFCEPWMGVARLRQVVDDTNALKPDAILLLGDYEVGTGIQRFSRALPHKVWAEGLSRLKAPLGVHAILGNHDWWEDAAAQRAGKGPTQSHLALADAGIRVHENTAIRLEKQSSGKTQPFWLCGIGDQWAFTMRSRYIAEHGRSYRRYRGMDDLDGTLAQVRDSAPVILMVHEPDIFPKVPARVSLTVAGHTHGGQVRVLGYAPIVPSRFRNRYVYGHIVEDGRHMIVSAGLGVSGLPVRLGAPAEIVVVDLGGGPAV